MCNACKVECLCYVKDVSVVMQELTGSVALIKDVLCCSKDNSCSCKSEDFVMH